MWHPSSHHPRPSWWHQNDLIHYMNLSPGPQEELLRGAAAAGLSAEDQVGLAAGSDSVAVQQQAQGSGGDAVVAGAAGAAAYLAHSTRAALRDVARRDDAS